MKRYTEYKDSGVPWIGDIPGHWEVHQLRNYLSLVSDKGYPDEQLLSVTRESGVIIRNTDSKEENHNFIPDDLSNYKLVKQGQFAVNKMKAWQGSYGVSQHHGIVSPAYYVCNLHNINPAFFSVAIRSKAYVPFFTQMSKGIRSGQWDLSPIALKQIFLIEPPLAEQEKIVAFLDKQTNLIESCICLRERELQTLNELKQAKIASAVTRGLNPDVPMKDSGIPWIGMIPAHWSIAKMRSIFRLAREKTEEERKDLLSLSQYTGIQYKTDVEKTGMFEAESTIGYNVVHAGQFVMNIMLAWNGSYAVSNLDGIISPSYCVFDFIADCDKRYIGYLLQTEAYKAVFKSNSKGLIDSRLRLYPNRFMPLNVALPPVEEQRQIANYIDNQLLSLDDYISCLEKEIEYLKEYKQRLISDVVTGKVDVRDEA